MLEKIMKRLRQRRCEHKRLQAGCKGVSMEGAVDYFKCRDCGMYGDNSVSSSLKTKKNYDKLELIWFKNTGIS